MTGASKRSQRTCNLNYDEHEKLSMSAHTFADITCARMTRLFLWHLGDGDYRYPVGLTAIKRRRV
ncbi:hypothetical protein YERSI8AC_290281 [Enterobacterales bacterium 8AC]|nr:hypothetical protein YERSI8AC_290281 [Enterobacterales bacterium 8AC]